MLTSIFHLKVSPICFAVVLLVLRMSVASAQTTGFTYQGKLSDGANPASGAYDFQFKLFDTVTVGTGVQQGPTITNPSVTVTVGIFTVQLDFGAGAFSGPPRFLEIGVRPAASPNPYTLLSPRQPVTSTPYSVRSLNSSVADVLSSACVGCVTSTQVGGVSGSVVTGPIPVASVPAGSGNYVQNTINQQSADFNISGNGTAGGTLTGNAVNAATQYNIGGNRVFTVSSLSSSVFAGLNAGAANGLGGGNSFFGNRAGESTALGANNSFFGKSAGNANTASDNSFFGALSGDSITTGTRNSFFGSNTRGGITGNDNSFFGYRAGLNNTASFNSFFGSQAGDSTTSGTNNAFFGYNSGTANTTGFNNAFFGYQAGPANTASNNTFFGSQAGSATTSGGFNTFVGTFAGNSNTTGNHLTIIGEGADVTAGNLSFATAIGAGSTVGTNSTINIGRANGSDVLQVAGTTFLLGDVYFGGVTGMGTLDLCLATDGKLSFCSSSLRYKTNVQKFTGGLDIVRRLRPITFDWNQGGLRDVGFAAEEVEQVEPLLATYNKDGQIEGVKYKQISTVLVNAINEQQAQLAEQQCAIQELRQLNQSLEKQLRQLQQQLHAFERTGLFVAPARRRLQIRMRSMN